MYPLAAEILLFDAVIQNTDRRTGNPNCLVRSNELLIFDHELTFMHRLILNWQPPWVQGGMKSFETPGNHIFVRLLKGKQIDFGPVRQLWNRLSDIRLKEYEATIPKEWDVANCAVAEALKLIADARDSIDDCIGELERILS